MDNNEELKRLLSGNCTRVKVELKKNFPITFYGEKNITKFNGAPLSSIVLEEDLPGLIGEIGSMTDKHPTDKTGAVSLHFRVNSGAGHRWFLFSAQRTKDIFDRTTALSGAVIDVTNYLEATRGDLNLSAYRERSNRQSADMQKNLLGEILDMELLRRLQSPFKNDRDIVSAIIGSDESVVCSSKTGAEPFVAENYKYARRVNIRVARSDVAYWVIASNTEGETEKHLPLLQSLSGALSQMANAYVLLEQEMNNAAEANRRLGEHMEQQIIVNDLYNIMVTKSPRESLIEIMSAVGRYIGLGRIGIYRSAPEQKLVTLENEWCNVGVPPHSMKEVGDDEYKTIKEELSFFDSYYPASREHDLVKFNITSFFVANLYAGGTKYGFVLFEYFGEWKLPEIQVIRIMKSASQMLSSAIMRLQLDESLAAATERLKRLAFEDMTIGVPNRQKLDEDMKKELAAERQGVLVLLKVTNMRLYNELFGMIYTDKLLGEAARYIRDLLRPGQFVYRFSGTMLAILMISSSKDEARTLTGSILSRFTRPFFHEDSFHTLESGAGIALYTDNGDTPDEIYRAASLALYRSSDYGTNSFAFYTDEFEGKLAAEYNEISAIRSAVHNGMEGFELKFQPEFDIKSGKVTGCEAFADFHGMQPKRLISLSESMGLDLKLDRWIISSACRFCKQVREMFAPDFTVSVNITARELQSGAVAAITEQALAESGLSPEALYIELPETSSALRSSLNLKAVKRLRELGVKITVDGYEYGFMSVQAFKSGFVDMVKCDASLFTADRTDNFDKIVFDTAMAVAKMVPGGICVKRIEFEEQITYADEYNITKVQGFLYNKPLYEVEFLGKLFPYSRQNQNTTTER
ncbi:MAG: bifunctional diguanylate cyclase/phosphodiesterase [Oscillospiraceae bacterium]|nr:bifunctional diguanylate cyclase/phosphodiesterase [Oscillospiraceae bacterium]